METITLSIPSINCNHCVNTIQMEISEMEGVNAVAASAETKSASFTFTPPATETAIRDLLKEINYPATI